MSIKKQIRPSYDYLIDNGDRIDSTNDGTCILYQYGDQYYVVLCDNTVITQQEDIDNEGSLLPEYYN